MTTNRLSFAQTSAKGSPHLRKTASWFSQGKKSRGQVNRGGRHIHPGTVILSQWDFLSPLQLTHSCHAMQLQVVQMCLSCHSKKHQRFHIVRSIFAHLEGSVCKHPGVHSHELIRTPAAVRMVTDLPGVDVNSWPELIIPGLKNIWHHLRHGAEFRAKNWADEVLCPFWFFDFKVVDYALSWYRICHSAYMVKKGVFFMVRMTSIDFNGWTIPTVQ